MAAGHLTGPHAMNPSFDAPDDPPVPYQQMTTMAPRTPVPISTLRTGRGRRKSSSLGSWPSSELPPLIMVISQFA